jgi:hypothetical protein
VTEVRARDVPWELIRRQWPQREFGALREAVPALEGFGLGRIDDLLDGETGGEPATELEQAFAVVDGDDDAELLLALFVYAKCLDKWERSSDYERIRGVIRGLRDAVDSRGRERDDVQRQLVDVIVGEAECMERAMAVENAMNCSCPVAMGKEAEGARSGTESVLRELETIDGTGFAELRELLASDAETQQVYFGAVGLVAKAVLDFVEDEPEVPRGIDETIEALRAAEAHPAIRGDVYESELRSHRDALAALRELAPRPRLEIAAAELVYLYPFAVVDGVATAEAVAKASSGMPLESGTLGPVTVEQLRLTDLWEPRPLGETGYTGWTIALPNILVTTTADEQLDFDPEIRLTSLGNHCLRITSRLDAASLHELNQALRRGSNAMGEETLQCCGSTWTKFVDYADEVVRTVAALLEGDLIWNVDATYHVVVAAHALTVVQPDGSRRPADEHDLRETVGAALLLRPIRQIATSLEEWVRYQPPEPENLLDELGYVGEWAVRTANTTVLFMPASPQWTIDAYREIAEFIATMPPLLRSWETRAVEQEAEHAELAAVSADGGESEEEFAVRHAQERKLRNLEIEIRKRLALLHSPALCTTPTQRELLDRLWRAAGLEALERELESWMAFLSAVHARQSDLASAREEERSRVQEQLSRVQQKRQERIEIWVQLLLGVIAATSLTQLFAWIGTTFEEEHPVVSWIEVGLLVAIVLATGYVILRKWLIDREEEPGAGGPGTRDERAPRR